MTAEPFGHGRPWLIDAAELLAEPDPGPTPWLIENLIVDRSLCACVGKWKTTKSYALLDFCISIATGRPAFGALNVPEPGRVIFVNEESGRAALWRRLDSLARGRGIDPEELREKLSLGPNQRVKLDDPGWQNEITAIGKELRPRLFVFDPLARMKHSGRAENDQTGMAPLIEYMRELRDEADCAVAFVQHQGHKGEHMRGNSDLESAWETRLIWKRNGPKATVVALERDYRDAEPLEDLNYRIGWDHDSRTMRFDLCDSPKTDVEADARKWILEHVAGNPGQPRTRVEEAYAADHGKGARTLARKIIDGELTASTPALAKGKGRALNGTYLYPAPALSLPLANTSNGEHGEQPSEANQARLLASSPPSLEGARTASGERPASDDDFHCPDDHELERLETLARTLIAENEAAA